MPLDVPVDQLAVHEPDYKNLIAFLKAMEFNTITRRVAEKSGIDASQVEADAKLVSGAPCRCAAPQPVGKTGDLFAPAPQATPAARKSEHKRRPHPHFARHRARRGRAQAEDRPHRNTNACARSTA